MRAVGWGAIWSGLWAMSKDGASSDGGASTTMNGREEEEEEERKRWCDVLLSVKYVLSYQTAASWC
eukprot:279956-Hanusia_phi.AAC.1